MRVSDTRAISRTACDIDTTNLHECAGLLMSLQKILKELENACEFTKREFKV